MRRIKGISGISMALMARLAQSVTRRQGGLLVVGGSEGSAERQGLLAAALIATEVVGPAAQVLLPRRGENRETTVEGSEVVDGATMENSTCVRGLSRFPSVETAYEAGYRRIVIEGSADPGQWNGLKKQYGADTCLILGTCDVEVKSAFMCRTASDWDALDGLLGIVTAVRSWGTWTSISLYDAFVRESRPLNRNRYESAVDAVQASRQFMWEGQALANLDAGRITASNLRELLLSWGMLSARENDEIRGVEPTDTACLRLWLYERLLVRPRLSQASRGGVLAFESENPGRCH